MKNAKALKRELDQQVSRLSEDRLQEVLDFVGELLQKKEKGRQMKSAESLPPEQDPILDMIGMVDVGPDARLLRSKRAKR